MRPPNHSPVTVDCIQRAVEEIDCSTAPAPKRVKQLLDEIQLAAAQMPNYPDSLVELGEEVAYLHVYKQGRLIFLSGLYAEKWLQKWLPDCTPSEREGVKTALKLYAKSDGFRVSYPDMVVPIALRMVKHDDLVMDEPGAVDPNHGRPA